MGSEKVTVTRSHHAHWIFGPFELIPSRQLLEKHGARVAISPKPLAVLIHLIAHRERVVPRAELLAEVWPGVTVSKSAFLSVLRDLRRALDDEASNPLYVATERGQGLRFIGSIYQLPAPGHEAAGPDSSDVWERAAVNLERALTALDTVDQMRGTHDPVSPHSRTRAELVLALGRARWAAGRLEDARHTFLEAIELARTANDADSLAGAALGFVGRTDAPLAVNRPAVALLEEALAALPPNRLALRAELLARLGSELYYNEDGRRSRALTAEAIEIAESSDDSGVLAYALTARHYTLMRPEVEPSRRLPLSERVLALLGDEPVTDVICLALQQRQVDLLELGDGSGYREVLQLQREAADAMAVPYFRWMSSVFSGNLDLMTGAIEDAEHRAQTTLELGQRIGTPNAMPIFAAQLFAIRREQDRLGELAPLIQSEMDRNQDQPIFRCALGAALACDGRASAATPLLQRAVERDLEDIPHDMHRMASLAMLATAAARLKDSVAITRIQNALQPYAGRVIATGYGAAIEGAVSHHLGTLAMASGEAEDARNHFDAAIELHERLGAALWVARSKRARSEVPAG
jgi:DNA-binding winged helix-turn-helix (wHTH) protein